jgi:hypothetical protein
MTIMDRRKFLTYLTSVPIVTSELMANTEDFYLSRDEFHLIISINKRLKRLKRYVGYATFNIISYPDALYYARNYSAIGAFTKRELAFIDRLFHEDPRKYGFYGPKTCLNIENKIALNKIDKIPHTGHYLFKGKPQRDYKNILSDIGNTLILTSGIRNVIKQLSLYVNKIYHSNGNMTKATISIAPPSYSYHTVSDFDVGRKDWGYKNFTADFALTNEFEKMTKLEYIGMRYEKNNKDGVRFEPWHVEVI